MIGALFLLCIALKTSSMAASDGGNPFDRPCPNFSCRKRGVTAVPKAPYEFTSSGCAGMNGGGGMMVSLGSESDGPEVYESCCDEWHACYQVCGVSKAVCDEGFKECTKEVCKDDEDCTKSADLKALLMQFSGCQTFDAKQKAACSCVPDDKVAGARESATKAFYERCAPDSVDKAAGLAAKADKIGKMAALLRKLIRKYPKCIKHIDPPPPPDMLNDLKKMREEQQNEEDDEPAIDDVDEVQEL